MSAILAMRSGKLRVAGMFALAACFALCSATEPPPVPPANDQPKPTQPDPAKPERWDINPSKPDPWGSDEPRKARRIMWEALEWFAAHQLEDGSWSCDHGKAPGHRGRVDHAGTHPSRTGATGLAVLCFLEAGQTSTEGERFFRPVVAKGIEYLVKSVGPNGRDLAGQDGTPYDRALAAWALCEAYGTTRDKTLAGPAQTALDAILLDQIEHAGGGRPLRPGDPGRLSVAGCNISVFKAGYMAFLKVDPKSVNKTIEFLDGVRSKDGTAYGETAPGDEPTATAVGLLCRIRLGGKEDDPILQKGWAALRAAGPDPTDLARNYCRTEIAYHTTRGDFEAWSAWQPLLRERLAPAREAFGEYAENRGSFAPAPTDPPARVGGRHVATGLACLAFERVAIVRRRPISGPAGNYEDF